MSLRLYIWAREQEGWIDWSGGRFWKWKVSDDEENLSHLKATL